MTQTLALFVDAYRQLNARKMFWVTMLLSAVVLSVLFAVSISENPDATSLFDSRHLKLMFWDTPFPVPPGMELETLLKGTFLTIGLGLWLTWAAAILALISTASIIPDFLSAGSIDLILSKPIGRLRAYLTKYAGGLLFVAIQVTVFSAAAFLIIGFRTGAWEFGLFIAVPLVVAFFSYLFSVCALVGTVTRSAITSLLVTMLFWLLLFAANFSDEALAMPRVANEIYVQKLEEKADELRTSEAQDASIRLVVLESQLQEAIASRDLWRRWHGLIVGMKTSLPKTSETIGLMERWLIEIVDLPDTGDEPNAQIPFITPKMRAAGVRSNTVARRVQEIYRDRSALWVLGTSFIFEGIVLGLACIIFVRRDY
ncbi:MAG: ABC transporter permease [Planctomycetes bacterium]|nr:ABC transporter permease [Planctomycetota bacterium]MCH8258872.1 ABC transporter permease [Planctomycetota bacterium]